MRNLIAILILLAALLSSSLAHARGGQDADDCPPGSSDPDCKDSGSSSHRGK